MDRVIITPCSHHRSRTSPRPPPPPPRSTRGAQPYTRFVEIGRVCLINYGPDEGKLCMIIDVVDQNKALVDGPMTGVVRQMMPFKRLSLTDIYVKVRRSLERRHFISMKSESPLRLHEGEGILVLSHTKPVLNVLCALPSTRQVPRNARTKVMKAAWEENDIKGKWAATSWAKKLAAKKKRADMTDFDRFKLMVARKQRSAAVKKAVKSS